MIDRDEVKRIADLAHLRFSEGELDRFAGDLSRILDYIDQLREVTLADAESGSPVVEATPLREDVVTHSLPVIEIARNAPAMAHDYFVVPKVIGEP